MSRLVAALWSLAVGIGQVAFWPVLPWNADFAAALLLGLVLLALVAAIGGSFSRLPAVPRYVVCYLLLPFALGSCWALGANHHSLAARLPLALHGTDHRVTLEIDDLPQTAAAVASFGSPRSVHGYFDSRFRARVLESDLPDFIGKRLLLSWYGLPPDSAATLTPGSRWSMTLRLKRPRGSINPHTFDYEAWLLEQGIFATGYVRDRVTAPEYLAAGNGISSVVNGIRERLRQRITGASNDASDMAQEALIRALLLGDKGGIDTATQDLLRRTGTAHLLAISGLHVGMVAGFCLLIGGLLSRVVGVFRPHNPVLLAAAPGLLAALAYTLLSGASLSAQRALVMTAIAIAALVLRRRVSAGLVFVAALSCVLLMQPLAVLNAGFWLSFIAVAALLLRFRGRSSTDSNGFDEGRSGPDQGRIAVLVHSMWRYFLSAIHSQWAILVGLLLPSILIFSGVSVSGLLINLIAIPWVGLAILPLIFLGAMVPHGLGTILWRLADTQLGWLLEFLAAADQALPGWQAIPNPAPVIVALAVLSSLVLLMPRGTPGRVLGWCLFPVLVVGLSPWQRPQDPYLALTVLDVGQGLAVVAATEGRTIVFDTGASTGTGWSAGSSIVAPYLLAEGRPQLDALIVSHGDRDHAGGVSGVMAQLEVGRLFAPGQLPQRLADLGAPGFAGPCVAGRSESYGELELTWLWPGGEGLSGEENDHSCVALLEWRHVRVLLTGDISEDTERRLVVQYPGFAPIDVLLAPHHGSRTSSSPVLLDWANPAQVVFSTGFHHHFGHPHADVVARYAAHRVPMFNTAANGAVTFRWRDGHLPPEIRCARNAGNFWLSEPDPAESPQVRYPCQ
ncbi:DNA internalization-related competence protein ComEC/Rec2 [Microbulbifer pacificus]|uniref:DNA internalization-related competence protein ComEC/Rec2 n=1 Tax=Microbulbifer pacificus TaxID=407164 RepID=A0AAU0MXY2_9GAMM|nr:DNA internalization-related competence protein ComEC/Rec2 [Microbulbifer pacificus]WOX05540.1 DNA internalization-related competence protein ComEC/Rec2 [Microbulbifer pacificus]